MKADLLTEPEAQSLYTLLVKHTGCSDQPSIRAMAVNGLVSGKNEVRLHNSTLGFGGKYWPVDRVVSCYIEDKNAERRKIIQETNEAIREWFENA
jgi:hypothetical protein